MNPKKVLCVCIGNSDRSPMMSAVLGMYLKSAGHEVVCDSAGISETAGKGGAPSPFAVAAGKLLGLDLSGHNKRHVNTLNLKSYDLIICASDEIAGEVIKHGAEMKKIFNAQITNPWPVQFEQDYETTMVAIVSAMYRVVTRYFKQ